VRRGNLRVALLGLAIDGSVLKVSGFEGLRNQSFEVSRNVSFRVLGFQGCRIFRFLGIKVFINQFIRV
jgi:hypothetical protein